MMILTDGVDTILDEFYSVAKLKNANPSTSFPGNLTDAVLADFNVYRVQPGPQPAYDPAIEHLDYAPPVKVSGVWTRQWIVVPWTTGELLAREKRKAEREFQDDRKLAFPPGYDQLDIEVVMILMKEINEFQAGNSSASPLIDIIASTLGVGKPAIVNRVKAVYADYSSNLVTAWAKRRKAQGGA